MSVDQDDVRVSAVLDVLRGEPHDVVAERWRVDVALLERWVDAFVAAGTAQVLNQPTPDQSYHRDRFLTAFAHEVRTPLSIAKGWVAVLLDHDLSEEQTRARLERLHKALERLTDRSLDVELMGAASLGRLVLNKEVVPVSELLARLDGLEAFEGDDVGVAVDPDLFARVLHDLWEISTRSRRRRRVEVRVEPPWVEVLVSSALQMAPEQLQALFEPFESYGETSEITFGLYLARALTVAHGGALGADQDEHGLTLWVRIPAHAASSASRVGPMTFRLACGDVMPGCAARFEADDRDQLLNQVAEHAAVNHGITEITPEVLEAVVSKISVA